MRTQLERSAGISSLASLGLAFFVLVAHRVWTLRAGPLPRALRVMAWLLGALTLFRAFAWAERLALIEVGVVVALFCFGHGDMTRPLLRRIRQALPLLAATSVIGFFALAEFDRSWSSHYAAIESSYGSFIAQRLVNYYYQALNNGAGMITVMDWPSYQFSNLLHWLHQFPVLLGPIVRYLTTARPNDFLERFGDPEFSNSSGLFAVFYDAGLPLGILLLAVFGCLAQSAYQAFRERDNVMGLLFPVFFMGLIEFFRFWYIGNSRAFLLIVALLLAIVLARQRMRPDRSTST
jgi:oligosaccharide repeat unit polymerase